MKIRLIRMASEKQNITIAEVSMQFLNFGVLNHIEDNFDLFHVQGDEAIYSDIMTFLNSTQGKMLYDDSTKL